LVPFLAAQETFKAQAEAKYLADELEAKLAPAEAIDEKAFKFYSVNMGSRRKDVFVYIWALAVALAVRCSFLKTIGCQG